MDDCRTDPDVSDLIEELQEIAEETADFLEDWLARHVIGSDQALAAYLKNAEPVAAV